MPTSPDNYCQEDFSKNIIDIQQYKNQKEELTKNELLQVLLYQIQEAQEFYDQLNQYGKTAQLCAANKYFQTISENEEMYSMLSEKINRTIQTENDIPIRNILKTLQKIQQFEYKPFIYLFIKETLSKIKPTFNKSKYHQQLLTAIQNLQSKCSEQSFYSGQTEFRNS